MTSSVASRPGFLRWLVTAGDPATLVATFSTAAGSPVNLSGSTVAAACANWSTSHAGSATVGGASNNEVTVAFTDTITGQLTGGGWTWTLTVDGVTTLAGPLDVAQPGVAGVTGGDASAVVVVDDVNVAVTVTTTGTPGASALNDLTDVDTATDPPAVDDVLAWDGSLWTPAALTAADTGAIPESLIDAKGDVIVGTANDTAARLAVGADGQVLTADSGEASGVKWTSDFLPKVAGGASVEDIGAVESNVLTVAATGATETLDTATYGVFDCTMDQPCEFTFSNPAPSGKATIFTLILRGAFTPTLPATVKWAGAAPGYTTPSQFVFTTVDGGATWLGQLVGKGFA